VTTTPTDPPAVAEDTLAQSADPAPEALPPATEIPADLGRRTARGAGATLAGQCGRILLQLLSVTVLARLLSPRDYGLLAVGLVVVGIGEVVRDFGLSSAAIRAPQLTARQRDGLFWINSGAGVLMALLAATAAVPIAAALGQPAVVPIIRALALTFVLNGVAAQYRAGLNRDLRFAALAGTDLLAQSLALVSAVAAALLGAGYWALVVQQLTLGTVTLVGAVAVARWRPRRPRRGAGLRPLLRFGGGLTGTGLVYYLGNNLDNLVLAMWAGPTALGLYNRGFQLLMTPLNQLRTPTTRVAVPVLARLQADLPRSGEYLRRAQLALGFTLVPGMAMAAGAAGPVVDLLLGPRWHEVAPVLALLAVAGSAQTLAYVGSWVYLSRGLAGPLFRYTTLTLVLNAVCIATGSAFGVVGVASGYATAALLEWPLSLWWLSRITPIPVRALLQGALRIAACALLAGAACFEATQLCAPAPAAVRIVVGAAAGLGGYGLACVVPAIRADLRGVVSWARQMIGR
jgi:PST family polysaccharide transporter